MFSVYGKSSKDWVVELFIIHLVKFKTIFKKTMFKKIRPIQSGFLSGQYSLTTKIIK